ncbi:Crp/Fnr family transcriptional regulator [Hymenobacter wooponensis]|uniref:Crp/Fnr family transcriptional regulator n=1 Tax=Hymenobacter wooponensis TaxID=1525360 RepID=A0A4Z0MDU5_9BACT|nr:Crp/Fnr family transcriptional regulator [Hymenobacter wooponensis]TGD77540.1 Crp/Fnr family transcriptional regulator [Hymenobacter wooponensis]
MQALRNYIDHLTRSTISDADFALITAELLPYKLYKKQYLLQAGEVCRYQAFVVEGALRLYTLDARGNKQVHVLGVENMWIGDRQSWSQLMPSRYYIDAVEDSQLLLINCPQAQELVRRVPLVAELVRIQDERNAIAAQQRLHDAIACTAEERYAAFVAQYPGYVQRFSQLMIASYLGISPETLSRIRTKLPHIHSRAGS